MAYNPNIYNPYLSAASWPTMQAQGTPVNGLVYIDTVDDARNYQMPPNSVSPPLMLKSDNVFIIKTVDGSGGAVLSAYRFEETQLPIATVPGNDYVTKADFDAFASRIMEAINGEYTVPESESE